jgi:hypothetical protein
MVDIKTKFKNGQKVKDRLSGFEGTITCEAIYLNGCIRYYIQPELDGEGHYQESQVIDEEQLELIEKELELIEKEPEKETKKNGGDRPGLPKYKL